MSDSDGSFGEHDPSPDDERRIDPNRPLPPSLHPRGRRAGRHELRAYEAQHAADSTSDPHSVAPVTRTQRRQSETQARRTSPMRHGVLLGTRIAAALLSIFVLVAGGWSWATYRTFTSDLRRVDAIPAPGTHHHDVDGKAQNILIVGNDDRDSATDAELKQLGTTRDGGSYNTDTMMLLHLPADGSRATIISFPRDSYVQIPGHGMNKLNAAYPLGVQDGHGNKSQGAKLLVQTIQQLTGLTIDHFVQVDLLGFYRISNAIGGVQVCLIQAQHDTDSGINLPAGKSTIKGTQALAFVRQRHGLPNGDLDRIKRQQYFLSASFRKLTSAGVLLNPLKLQHLLNAVSQSVQMDNSLDPIKLAQLFSNITAGKVTFSTIPTDGFANVDVGSVVVVHPGAVKDWVDKMIGAATDSRLAGAPLVAPSTVSVAVLNGSNANGVAGTSATTLRSIGFKVAQVGDSPDGVTDTTKIEYANGMQSQAKTLAQYVPGAALVETSTVDTVTLVLGTDGVSVKKSAAGATSSAPAKTPTASPSRQPGVTTAADAGCIY